MTPKLIRAALALAAVASLFGAYSRTRTPPAMVEAARNLLAALNEEQRAKALFPVDHDLRDFWQFIPTPDVEKRYGHPRPGLTLREMTPEQKNLAAALLSTGLSPRGYSKARTVMSLEEVLRLLEEDTSGRRDPERYHFSIFGKPSDRGAWGYRVEGHHVSLHYLVVNGRLAASPTFFGANPREVRTGPRQGLRTLPREEDLGRALLLSLDDEQRAAAIVSPKAYSDILTSADRVAKLENQPSGLSRKEMTPLQQELLDELVGEYAGNMPPEIAERRMAQLRQAGDDLYFAWAGAVEPGGPHYYRVRAPSFLIEYDCTQNGANHIHAVWRDWTGDFGRDLLAEHYRSSHR